MKSKVLNKSIAIVANDAGAAAHIFAWLESGLLNFNECMFCLEGPAAKMLKLQQPNIELHSLEDTLIGAKTLISGTGWSSSLEYDARVLAKKKNIKSIAVIDHWVNYKERFIKNNEEVLPDVIWVSDTYAHKQASLCFPNIEIIEQRNDYLLKQLEKVNNQKIKRLGKSTNILYVLEPIRDPWAGNTVAGEYQALDFFINSIPFLNFGDKFSLILKPHPSDPENKYEEWLNSINLSNIFIEEEKSLSNLIAWSDVVVGCETYAMVVAVSANKRVISSLPKHAHNCRLPFEEIEHLNKIN